MMSDTMQNLGAADAQPDAKAHFVHVYTVIRIKVAVRAKDHRAAMEAADAVVFGDQNARHAQHAVWLDSDHPAVLDSDYAEEVTEYLVDEADDPTFERSRSYGPDYVLRRPCADRRPA